jgi:hypothetical protein
MRDQHQWWFEKDAHFCGSAHFFPATRHKMQMPMTPVPLRFETHKAQRNPQWPTLACPKVAFPPFPSLLDHVALLRNVDTVQELLFVVKR